MYTDCSEAFKAAVHSDARSWRARLSFTGFYIYNIDKIKFTNGSQSGKTITVGSVVAPTAEIVLTSLTQQLVGRSFTLQLGILPDISDFTGDNPDSDYEYIPIGRFKVVNVKRNDLKYTLECTHKLSAADLTYRPTVVLPSIAEYVLLDACNQLGLTLRSTSLPPITVTQIPECTVREIIGWCAALYGCFATADRSDGVLLKWYEDSGETLSLSAVSQPELSESDLTYGIIRCQANDTVYTAGTSGEAMEFTDPLMTPAVFDEVAQGLLGFSYRPSKITQVLANPLIDVWDIVELEYDDETYSIPVTEIILEFAGGLTGVLNAKGQSSGVSDRIDPITRAVAKMMKAIDENKSEIEADMSEAIREATEAIRGGADGFFYIITDSDGINKETIWCNNIDPYQATHGIRINSEGIGFWSKTTEPDKNIFNGTYRNAWTIDGSLIADFIRAGVLKGIRIECDEGSIAGWEIIKSGLISPDESLKLESSYAESLTTYKYLRDNGYTYEMLRELSYTQIRYLYSQIVGQAQITTSSGDEKAVLRAGVLSFYNDENLTVNLNSYGTTFYRTDEGNSKIGYTGYNRRVDNKYGLVSNLDEKGDFISWGVFNPDSGRYSQVLTYERAEDAINFFRKARFQSDLTLNGKLTLENNDKEHLSVSQRSVVRLYDRNNDSYPDPFLTIEDRAGMNFYKNDTYLGGIKMRGGGVSYTVSKDADLIGWYAESNAYSYSERPVWAYYREDDVLKPSVDIQLDWGGTNKIRFGEQGTDLTPNRLNFKTGSGSVIGYFGKIGTDDGIKMDLIDGDKLSWADNGTEVLRYNKSNGFLDILCDVYVPNNKQIDLYSPIYMHNYPIYDSSFQSTSDERLKENIRASQVKALDILNALDVIQFDWKDSKEHEDIGFSAQQAGSVSQDLQGDTGEHLTVNEGRLIRYLVKAVQELTEEIKELKKYAGI